jgi:hypothetical protein
MLVEIYYFVCINDLQLIGYLKEKIIKYNSDFC